MLRTLTVVAAGVATAAVLSACSVVGGKAAPEPAYVIVSKSSPFEVRDYPELILAKTTMVDGENDGFRRLFRYISGANRGSREVAMTAPVLEKDGTEIAMTAPVLTEGEAGAKTEMAFILPDEFTAETAPVPTDPAVRLDVTPARRVAVISFNGRASDDDFAVKTRELEEWIEKRGLTATGRAEFAQYNPPWTIPSMRRNEVLIPIAIK